MLVTSVLIELITNPDNTRTRAVNTGKNTRREQDPGTENYRSETQRRETERERERRRRKLGLITSCIFKQAHSPCGGESSILGETHEKEGDMRRQRERRSRLVKWR